MANAEKSSASAGCTDPSGSRATNPRYSNEMTMSSMRKESIMNETQDVDVLNEGLQGEYFAITAYDAALGTGLLSARATTVAKGFQADHRAHAQAITEAIERLGERASAAKTWKEYAAMYPPPKLESETDLLEDARSEERRVGKE